MNSLQIDKILKENSITKNSFLGVYPCDDLPSEKLPSNSALVINLCDSTTAGCHWVSVVLLSEKKKKSGRPKESFYYWDVSGLPTHKLNHHVFNFFRRQNKNVYFNSPQLQTLSSITCGQHCIVYIYFKLLNISDKVILSFFDLKNLKNNDFIVLTLFKNICRK